MKKIVLIFLALTLVVMSCSADDTTGGSGTGGGAGSGSGAGAGANTPAGRSWASKVGGKTFTDSRGDRIKFTSNGIPTNLSYEGTWIDDDGVESGYKDTTTFSMPKANSANQVIIKSHYKIEWTKGPDKGTVEEEPAKYIGYELDDTGMLLLNTHSAKKLSDVNFDSMAIEGVYIDESNFSTGITEKEWFKGIEVGSIFISKNEFNHISRWLNRDTGDEEDAKITTYGFLIFGGTGAISVGTGRKADHAWDKLPAPKVSREETLAYAKDGNNFNPGEIDADRLAKSKYYKYGDSYIYAIYNESRSDTGNISHYDVYHLKYNENNPKVLEFIGTSGARDGGDNYMPKNKAMEFVEKKVINQ